MLAFLALLVAFVGPPDWTVTGTFAESMVVTGVVRVSGAELRSGDSRLAAFVDGEIRGVAEPNVFNNQFQFPISIGGEIGDGVVSFKAYDAVRDSVFDVQPNLPFDPSRPVGGPSDPVIFTPFTGGGPPAWSVDPRAFPTSMTVVAQVRRESGPVAEDGALVAAYLGDELRGVAETLDAGGFGRLAFLQVYGGLSDTGDLSFRVYLPSGDRTYRAQEAVPYVNDGQTGSATSPQPLTLFPGETLTGDTGWRMLAPPGADASAGYVLDPLWTQGYPGADVRAGTSNVLRYDEASGAYVSVASASAPWPRGAGRAVYVYADDDPRTPEADGEFPKTLPPIGIGPVGPFTFPLSFTPTSPEARGPGWNMLGNPFPFSLDWDAPGWTREGIGGSVYVWDPAYLGGNYRAWNGATGPLAGGVIPRGLAFWVQVVASGAELTAPDTPATADRGGDEPDALVFRVVSEERPGLGAEAFVSFELDATHGLDDRDAPSLPSISLDRIDLATVAAQEAIRLVVDARPLAPGVAFSVPIAVESFASGEAADERLALVWPRLDVPEAWRLTLVDGLTGARVDLRTESKYDFEFKPEDPAAARFALEIDPLAVTSGEPTTAGATTLGAPRPNPTSGAARVPYTLAEASAVRLAVYNATGRRVALIAEGLVPAGEHEAVWEPGPAATGVYLVRLEAGGTVATRRLVVTR